jgi:hypothetical protein
MSQILTVLSSLAVLSARKSIKQANRIYFLSQTKQFNHAARCWACHVFGSQCTRDTPVAKVLATNQQLLQSYAVPKVDHFFIHMPDLPEARQCSAASHFNAHLHLLGVNTRVFDSATFKNYQYPAHHANPSFQTKFGANKVWRLLCHTYTPSSRALAWN